IVKDGDQDIHVSMIIKPVGKPDSQQNYLIVSFRDMTEDQPETKVAKTKEIPEKEISRVEELEKELQFTKESLQTSIEELETSNEELKSINEEYQSTNEELQSTNEELETSREEMQSLNEELQTVNAELQQKVNEVQHAYNAMKNFIDNLEIPTLLLDNRLEVRQFSSDMTKIVKLIPADIGRSILDISNNLNNIELYEQAEKVRESARYIEQEVQTKSGYWYLMRILPFRTTGDRLEGIVITFLDMNELKNLKAEVRETRYAQKYAESIVETVREPLLVLDNELKVISANRSFFHTFQVSAENTLGRSIDKLGGGQWKIPDLINFLKDIIPKHESFENFLVEYEFPTIGYRKMLLNARRIYEEEAYRERILLAFEDITNRD
ncbi:MAG: PAS domain-containing protein, partial [Calditrichaceae bacterium]